ncbi:transcription factor ATOH8 isoform X1 [Bubalus kerabau]|uniref:transcription factor ATOH8 isoform X1 n=1 Tax=Bubalus carabanensis TaxID=3119969 RepID=UPI00244EF5E5|nr:transcription factor ATOH8 isoform X1 [Bubalus carabanensis]
MKHIPVLQDGPWKTVCVKELNGLKKLKRKGKEPARRANGYKTFRLDLEAPEHGATATNGLRDRTQRLQPVPTPVPARVAPAVPSGGGADTAGERGGARAPEVLDPRKRGFALGAVGPGLPTPPPPPPPPAPQGQVPGGPETQPFREPGLRPRILLCAPPARPTPSAPPAPPEPPVRPAPPTRPGESSYSSISHVIYNNHPDSSASPRKRPGEATAASSEIKALQQTRRLLANARERTRVHTISAAFEALRKQVPCYSYGQKLSKLAILRIACNYILSLARLADLDYSADHSNLSFSECVQRCTRTLQAEGRAKKRKGIFLTQGSNLGLLHCRQTLHQLRHQGSPYSDFQDGAKVCDVSKTHGICLTWLILCRTTLWGVLIHVHGLVLAIQVKELNHRQGASASQGHTAG